MGFAHRGGAHGGLENTLAAFARAVALGFTHLETDVHLTADGVLVAFHDDVLDRVTDRAGRIAALPWGEVARARVGGREPVLRFADLLDAFPAARVNVEPKADAAVAPLCAAVRAAGALDRVCVGSFRQARVDRARALLGPRLCTSLGVRGVAALRLAGLRLPLPAAGCAQVPVRFRGLPVADARLVAAAHARGLPVHVWTVDDPAEMRRLLDLGVDGLMSDDLEALRGVLRERGAWPAG